MDELTIDGKNYISSKRAAALTGYAKDYVGQLCREGRVEARLVGRSWYVYEPSIRKHRFEGEDASKIQVSKVEMEKATEPSEITNTEAVFETPVYIPEDVSLLSLSEKIEESMPPAVPVSEPIKDDRGIEEIEEAWQEWFKEDRAPKEPEMAQEAIQMKEEGTAPLPNPSIEETPVPLHIRKGGAPKVEYVDIPRISYNPAPHTPQPAVSKQKKPKNRTESLVVRAILLAVMILSVSVAFIGIGESNTSAESNLIRFIEGSEVIKSNK
jgi:hypothetical protein